MRLIEAISILLLAMVLAPIAGVIATLIVISKGADMAADTLTGD